MYKDMSNVLAIILTCHIDYLNQFMRSNKPTEYSAFEDISVFHRKFGSTERPE